MLARMARLERSKRIIWDVGKGSENDSNSKSEYLIIIIMRVSTYDALPSMYIIRIAVSKGEDN